MDILHRHKRVAQLIILGVFTLHILSGYAQNKGYYAGFSFEPMLGADILSNTPQTKDIDNLHIEIRSLFGFLIGMNIRKQFTSTLAIESGLGMVERNYQLTVQHLITQKESPPIQYGILAYQIPLKAMIRLPSSDNSYFSTSLGIQLDLYPSDVFAFDEQWQVETIRKNWMQGSFLANFGWEIHTHHHGIFYTGLSFTRPFVPPFSTLVGENAALNGISTLELNAAYFALNFRYYLNGQKN